MKVHRVEDGNEWQQVMGTTDGNFTITKSCITHDNNLHFYCNRNGRTKAGKRTDNIDYSRR